MARSENRWGDEDRDEPAGPRRDRERTSPVTLVLIVLGGLFVLGALSCGGLTLLGYRRAKEARMEADMQAIRAEEAENRAVMAAAEERARRAMAAANQPVPDRVPEPEPSVPEPKRSQPAPVVPDRTPEAERPPAPPVDDVPPPKPGSKPVADPPPQPKPTTYASDKADDSTRWRVLFRSKKPELWNTNTQAGDDFALPLRSAPKDTAFLRLRRMDTGDAVIVAMSRSRVGKADPAGRPVRWNGEGKDEHGGYHLGVAEGKKVGFTEGEGTIGVLMDGWDANPGSGFGHAHHVPNGGQRFAWLGKEIKPTAFEVAVTAGELTAAERKWLRE